MDLRFNRLPSISLTRNSLLRRLWGHVSVRRRKQLVILLFLMIMASFAEVVSIGAVLPFLGVLIEPEKILKLPYIQSFMDILGLNGLRELQFTLTIVFVVGALIAGGMRLTLLWMQTRLSNAIGADLSIEIYRRTLYQPYLTHVSRNSSEMIVGISNKANSVVINTILPLLIVISSILLLMSILMTLLVIEPYTALASMIGLGGIYGIIMISTRKILAHNSQLISKNQNQVIKALQEGLGGIRDVLIDGTQSTYCDIYHAADRPLRKAQSNITFLAGSTRSTIEALGMVLIAMLAYYISQGSKGITTALPTLGVLALGAQRLMPVLQQAYANWTYMHGGDEALRDALVLLDQPLPSYLSNQAGVATSPLTFQHQIELRNITFGYNADKPKIINKFNLTIPIGARLGIKGTTGSGKSTLLDIIMGLLPPNEGELLIDGVALNETNMRLWQTHIAHVPQSIFLADTTIAENIAFGMPEDQIDFQRVKQAAQKAQIAETIEAMPAGYQTLVGERGVRLSGGQRQRIGIARALYKQADVIVFDEATSALDNDTEQSVIEAIEQLGQDLTIIIVAHRLTTLKNCTAVISLENPIRQL